MFLLSKALLLLLLLLFSTLSSFQSDISAVYCLSVIAWQGRKFSTQRRIDLVSIETTSVENVLLCYLMAETASLRNVGFEKLND
jgi:hypothetical protein